MGRREARAMVNVQGSWVQVVAVFMALALVASACGGGDSAESAADADDASAENAPAEEGEDQTEVDETGTPDAAEEPADSEDVDDPADAADPADVEVPETTEVPTTTTTAPEEEEVEPAEIDPGDGTGTGPDFIDTDPDSEFCVAARNIDVDDVLTGADDPFGAGLFEGLDGVYAELQPFAPAELEEDIVVIREFVAQIIPILESDDIFSPDVAAELDPLNSDSVDESGERFDAYLTQVCGVDGTAGFGGGVGGGGGSTGETLDETISLDSAGSFTGTLEEGTYDLYQLGVFEGSTLTITMESAGDFELDPLLRVVDPSGAELENDDAPDDAGLGLFDSQVIIDPTVGGLYSIEARSFFGTGSGEFTLTIEVS